MTAAVAHLDPRAFPILAVLGVGMVAMLVGLVLSVTRYRELCEEERSVQREREEWNRWRRD